MGWYKESYQAKQIIAQQQAAELKYLKAQINPHFLFNTLNSLYGLSLEESKKVPDLILKLSDILSYSLYESSVEKVNLYKEIRLIEDFIALEKERYGDRMKVAFVKEDGLETLEIAINEAHSLGKKIMLANNIAPHNAKIKTYIKDIAPVIALKPDAMIMSDPGMIMLVREHFPDQEIQFGITRDVLSRELSLKEIVEITEHCPDMEILTKAYVTMLVVMIIK